MWAVLVNIAVVLFVINGAIWLRARRRPVSADERAMFGTVAAGFGGADFVSAALVVILNLVGAQIARVWAGAGGSVTDAGPPPEVNWVLVWIIQASMVVANWVVIAWRNAPVLDWRWSGVAAVLIFLVSIVSAIVSGIFVGA